MAATPEASFWRDKSVLVTGHTGFIGSWLSAALHLLGARVTGIALAAETPSHYALLAPKLSAVSHIVDIRDGEKTRKAVTQAAPDIVFHLAAESLVRRAHAQPAASFATNLMGTVHLLDALRHAPALKAAVMMTTDKVYLNHESPMAFREEDRLGGIEPYGASKACAEIAIDTYRASYLSHIGLAAVRAGNVIGGGDFSIDRLIPDYMRAVRAGEPLLLRHPHSTRPWQFVMEPVRACLMLAEALHDRPKEFSEAWNIGPDAGESLSVGVLVAQLAQAWGKDAPAVAHTKETSAPYEAQQLAIDSSKLRAKLGWTPARDLSEGLAATALWYKNYLDRGAPASLTFMQTEAWLHG